MPITHARTRFLLATLMLAAALFAALSAALAETPRDKGWLADYPDLLRARERQARLLRHLPPGQISFEDTATYSRTTINELPPGFHHLRIEREADVLDALAALSPYLALTEHDRFDMVVPGPEGPMSQTWLAISTPNGHLMLNRVLVLAVEQETGEIRGIQGVIEHGERLPTEPPMSADDAIEHALAAMADRSEWAEEGHGAYPVYVSGSPTCLAWQVMLVAAGEQEADDDAIPVELTVFVLGDGAVNRDRGVLACPADGGT
ncbi:MAG: hypothetical protein JJT88_19755 [Gammaproteobacteria bacterium]|nr:hypothetical protein [Gammaproteobacteria bacterium]